MNCYFVSVVITISIKYLILISANESQTVFEQQNIWSNLLEEWVTK